MRGGVFCMDARNAVLISELAHTIQAKPSGGRSLNYTPNVIYPQDNVECLTPWDSQGNRITNSDGVFQCIRCGKYSGYPQGYILHRAFAVQMDGSSKPDTVQDKTPTLTVPDKQSKVMAVVTENPVEGGGGNV